LYHHGLFIGVAGGEDRVEKTVLHVITGLRSGGAESMLVRLVVAENRVGVAKQVVISLLDDGVNIKRLRDAGIELHCLGLNSFARLPGAFIRLMMLMRRLRPEVVMTWLYHADFIGLLAAIVSGIGAHRVVWNVRCSNLRLSHCRWTTRLLLRLLAMLSSLPRAVAANSRAGRGAHEALGYRPRLWLYLPNGLDLDEYRPNTVDRVGVRTELFLPETTPVIGMVARVDPQKDHGTFLAAAKLVAFRYPQARFLLVGRGTEELVSEKFRLSVPDNLLLLGERHDVPRLIRALDVLVLSSAYGEGCPNILLEAMATELRCIVTNVGDAAAMVEDTGIVVAPESPKALAEAINLVLSEHPQIRAAAGQRARELVSQKYNLQMATNLYRTLWAHSEPATSFVEPATSFVPTAPIELSEKWATA
jgi:glycosyltransferase involved in cell wall biosynthesis